MDYATSALDFLESQTSWALFTQLGGGGGTDGIRCAWLWRHTVGTRPRTVPVPGSSRRRPLTATWESARKKPRPDGRRRWQCWPGTLPTTFARLPHLTFLHQPSE